MQHARARELLEIRDHLEYLRQEECPSHGVPSPGRFEEVYPADSTGRSWPDLIDKTFCDFTVTILDGWSGSAPGDP
jgi:hypothetical protein